MLLADKFNLDKAQREERIRPRSSHKKWERAVRWVRQNLKQAGLVCGDNKGLWELTEKAKAFLKNARPGIVLRVFEVIDDNNQVQGLALWGDAATACGVVENGTVNLILTSPPYPLITEKDYGNVSEEEYMNFFLPLAQQFYDALAEDGSMVLNVGPVFKKGVPVKSLYYHKLLVALVDSVGFHLAQECYWQNTGKLPTSYWVTVE